MEKEWKTIKRAKKEFMKPQEFIMRFLPFSVKKQPADQSERTELVRKP